MMDWFKAQASAGNGSCVEVRVYSGVLTTSVFVRDSKDPGGPSLYFTAAEWDAFLDGARNGEFDLP